MTAGGVLGVSVWALWERGAGAPGHRKRMCVMAGRVCGGNVGGVTPGWSDRDNTQAALSYTLPLRA